jgi:hypothetical protein
MGGWLYAYLSNPVVLGPLLLVELFDHFLAGLLTELVYGRHDVAHPRPVDHGVQLVHQLRQKSHLHIAQAVQSSTTR